MQPDFAKAEFLTRLAAAGLTLDAMTPAVGVLSMLAYYDEERVEGCPFDEDGDMLLFQWGTYDWGDGPAFDVNITRQLIVAGDNGEEPLQLGLTFRYKPADGVAASKGNQWCQSPGDLPDFRQFIANSAAMAAVGQRPAGSVTLEFGPT